MSYLRRLNSNFKLIMMGLVTELMARDTLDVMIVEEMQYFRRALLLMADLFVQLKDAG